MLTAFTEFAAAFSAPFPTSGRPGLHWANTTCTVLKGKVSRFNDGTQDETSENFASGAAFRHGQFESHVYSFEKDTYVACYGKLHRKSRKIRFFLSLADQFRIKITWVC